MTPEQAFESAQKSKAYHALPEMDRVWEKINESVSLGHDQVTMIYLKETEIEALKSKGYWVYQSCIDGFYFIGGKRVCTIYWKQPSPRKEHWWQFWRENPL